MDEYPCDNLQGCPRDNHTDFLTTLSAHRAIPPPPSFPLTPKACSQAWLQFNKFTLMLKITTREALLKTILILRFVGSEIYSDFWWKGPPERDSLG